MAAEIELLKSGMSELSSDNANIKRVLDIKQNKWTKVTKKAKNLNNPAFKTGTKLIPHLTHFKFSVSKKEIRPMAMPTITQKPNKQPNGDRLRTA